MSPEERSVLARAWEHRDKVTWTISTCSALAGLARWVTHSSGGLLGLLADVGAFAFGAVCIGGNGFWVLLLLEFIADKLGRTQSVWVERIVLASSMLAGGFYFLMKFTPSSKIHDAWWHLFVALGIATLTAPLIFFWYRFGSKPLNK